MYLCVYLYKCSMRVKYAATLRQKVDVVEQRDMVNLGAGGTKDRNLRTDVGCTSKYRTNI